MLIRRTSFDYVTVGHVTVDVLAADSSRRPGGGAFYSALQAARLGLRTLIVTQGLAPEIEALLEPYRAELELRILPAPATTTLETSWSGTARTQRLLAWGGPIAAEIAVETQILHFAPVARETSAAWRGDAVFVGLTPQGHARAWDESAEKGGGAAEMDEDAEPSSGAAEMDRCAQMGGKIVSATLPSDRKSLDALLPRDCKAVVVSAQESLACAPLLHAAAAGGAVIAITAGAGETSVQSPGGEVTRVPAPRVADPVDDLGAGDVFAAAFFVALHEGLPLQRAAAFGNTAAAIRIESSGADAIGNRSAIEARLAGKGARPRSGWQVTRRR